MDHQRQQALVAEAFCSLTGEIIWNFSFRRDLADIEVSGFARMIVMLDKIYMFGGKLDVRVWKPDIKGPFLEIKEKGLDVLNRSLSLFIHHSGR